MKNRPLAALLLLLALVAPLRADGPYLHGFDAISLLPPPPAPHSAEDMADRDSTFRIYSARTPEDEARGLAEHKVTIAAFAPEIGGRFKAKRFPLLAALFKEMDAETKTVIDPAKQHWNRLRPFVMEPARFHLPADPEKTPGYPSGHSTRGTLLALILAEIFPAQRDAILEKGRLIGWTRIELADHTPLDIYAGRVLGQALAQAFLRDPQFQRDLAAVKAEVAAAR